MNENLEPMNQLLVQFTQFSKDIKEIKDQMGSMSKQISTLTKQAQQHQSGKTISLTSKKQKQQKTKSKKNAKTLSYNGMYRVLEKEDRLGQQSEMENSELQPSGTETETETDQEQALKIRTNLLKHFKPREIPTNCTWLKHFVDFSKLGRMERNKALAVYSKAFIRKACLTARVILSELGLSADQKSIQPTSSPAGDTIYIRDGMILKLSQDIELGTNHYLYGGSSPNNERSSKASSAHVRGANAYFSLFFEYHLPVVVPIEVILDFNGYRLIAMPLLPLKGGRLVYGSEDGGQTIHNDEPSVDQLVRFAAKHLHLCGHELPNGKTTYAAGDVEVHIGSDGRLYMLGLGRALPPEASNLVSGLENVDSAVFFRMLRPELCLHLKQKYIKQPSKFPPLNPDALSKWGSCSQAKDHINVENATKYLLEERIDQLVEHLDQGTDTSHISAIFHQWGVPMRHMSLVRNKAHDIIKKRLLREMVQRSSKYLLREELRGASDVKKDINETLINFLNKLMHQNYDAVGFWTIWLPRDICTRFGKSALSKKESTNLWILLEDNVCQIVTYVCHALGLDLNQQHQSYLRENKQVTFSNDSIITTNVTWKTMSFIESILLVDLREEFVHTKTLDEAKKVLQQIASRSSRCGGSDLELANFCMQLIECNSESVKEMWEGAKGMRKMVGGLALKLYHGENRDTFLLDTALRNDLEGTRILEKITSESIVLLAAKHNQWILLHSLISSQFNLNAQDNHGDSALSMAALKKQWDLVSLMIHAKVDVKSNDQSSIPALISACEAQVWEVVEQLINAKASVNVNSKDGADPLSFVLDSENIQVLLTLLQANVNVSLEQDTKLQNVLNSSLLNLMENTDQMDTNTFHKLIEAKADINVSSENGIPMLIEATKNDNAKFVMALLNLKASANTVDDTNMTALHWASKNGDDDIVQILVEAKSKINAVTNLEETGLMIASAEGHEYVVEYLIAEKAKIDIWVRAEDTALMRASMGGHITIVRNLLDAKANIDAQNEQMTTSLIRAVGNDQTDVAICLLDMKANPHFRNKSGNSALLVSAERGNLSMVKRLISDNAAVDLKGSLGKTGLMFAASNGHGHVVEGLLDAKADINISARDGTMVMFHAASGGYLDMVENLADKKADINAKDRSGYTPLIGAACNDHLATVKKLVELNADIDATNKMGHNALKMAKRYKYTSIVTYLEDFKKKIPNKRDNFVAPQLKELMKDQKKGGYTRQTLYNLFN